MDDHVFSDGSVLVPMETITCVKKVDTPRLIRRDIVSLEIWAVEKVSVVRFKDKKGRDRIYNMFVEYYRSRNRAAKASQESMEAQRQVGVVSQAKLMEWMAINRPDGGA
jgi:hypothetical protein